ISCNLSLALGFSPVLGEDQAKAVSTAWPCAEWCETRKRLKPFLAIRLIITRLKPGDNERRNLPLQ
ncbi:MAG TPA: hypothetical protein VF437_09010, partial [Verrucomicrobiae bacterium]